MQILLKIIKICKHRHRKKEEFVEEDLIFQTISLDKHNLLDEAEVFQVELLCRRLQKYIKYEKAVAVPLSGLCTKINPQSFN